MNFPLGYIIALTPQIIPAKWPNMKLGANTEITSLKSKQENCLAYVLGEPNDVDMLVFSKRFDLGLCGLSNTELDHSIDAYVKLLSHFYNFQVCGTSEWEEGFKKIALYENTDEEGEVGFSHVALLLKNGRWRSKLGWLEDVEHQNLDVLAGAFYGDPILFMKRPKLTEQLPI